MTFADPAPTDVKDTLEAMRASAAAEGTRKGLAGAVQQALVKIFEVLLAMLLDFRAGRFAPLAQVAEAGDDADGAVAYDSPRPTASSLCSPARGEGGFHVAGAEAAAVMETGQEAVDLRPEVSATPRRCARASLAISARRNPVRTPLRFSAPSAVQLGIGMRRRLDAGRRRVAAFQKSGCARAYPRDEVVPA